MDAEHRASLSRQVALVILAANLVFFSLLFFLGSANQQASVIEQIRSSSSLLDKMARVAMWRPMTDGRDAETRLAFKDIAAGSDQVNLYMSDVRGVVTYTTREAAGGRQVAQVFAGTELPERLAGTGQGQAAYEGFLDMGGRATFVSIKAVPNRPECHHCHGRSKAMLGHVILTVDVAESFGRMAHDKKVLAAVSGGSLLALVLVVIIYIRRKVIRRVLVLSQASSHIAAGELDHAFAASGRDELGVLATGLKGMVQTLKDKIRESEQATLLAREESRRAREATGQAEEARIQAERARAEGMGHAAERIEGVVGVVGSVSESLATLVGRSRDGADHQARRLGETAAAMEQMNATVQEVARSAAVAAQTGDQARSQAQDGAAIVGRVVAGIGQVQSRSLGLKEDMGVLGRQAEGIGQILGVISDIADQTNLLALNAAIEAARAGDAGRGFAVVADEVRKLAEKTMVATQQVGEAIRGIQQGARKNVEGVEAAVRIIEEATLLAHQSGEALRQIVDLVDQTSLQIRSIAAASDQQTTASEEINRSVEEINSISAETSRAMVRSAQAVTELGDQVQELGKLVDELHREGGEA